MFAYYQTWFIRDCCRRNHSRTRLLSTWIHCSSSIQPVNKMGNTSTACQVTNYSKRNVRVFVTEKPLQIEAIITSGPHEQNLSVLSTDKKFSFWKNIECVRVLASQSQEVKWEPQYYASIFVEDEDDENICSKQVIHNMVLSAPINVLLYDV